MSIDGYPIDTYSLAQVWESEEDYNRRIEMSEAREELRAALDREDEVIEEMVELERWLIPAAHHIIANLSGLKKPQLQEALGWLQQFGKWEALRLELEASEEANPLPTLRELTANPTLEIPTVAIRIGGTLDGKGMYDEEGNNIMLAKHPHSSAEEEDNPNDWETKMIEKYGFAFYSQADNAFYDDDIWVQATASYYEVTFGDRRGKIQEEEE